MTIIDTWCRYNWTIFARFAP